MGKENDLVHIINTNSHVMWDVMVDYFDMTSKEQKHELERMFLQLQNYFHTKTKEQTDYSMFRKVLYPFSSFFMYVFDSSKIEDFDYGYKIKTRLIELINRKANALFMFGDYIVKPSNSSVLKDLFVKKSIDVSNWSDFTQYYLVCVIGISKHTSTILNNEFENFHHYCGFSDLTMDNTKLKSYLAMTIPQISIKLGNKLFFGVPDGEEDLDLNYSGFDFEIISKLRLELVSIPESLYLMFLTSRPQSYFMEEKEFNNSIRIFDEDIRFSNDYKINVPDEKIKYIKEHINLSISKNVLITKIKHAVDLFQISHICSLGNKHIKFNVPMEYKKRQYILSLRWDFQINQITIITVVPFY